jgi:Protein of unknown function (DUF1566)
MNMTTTFKPTGHAPALAALLWLSAGAAWAQQVCNSAIALTRPDSRYETVTGTTPAGSEAKDKVTGLVWKRCVEGMSWNGSACTGTHGSYAWTQALERARTASATTATPVTAWRLPNKAELSSLVETACYNPALNATWFPNQPLASPGYFAWSSSPIAGSSDVAWLVDFNEGDGGIGFKNGGFSVRLVRSGQ